MAKKKVIKKAAKTVAPASPKKSPKQAPSSPKAASNNGNSFTITKQMREKVKEAAEGLKQFVEKRAEADNENLLFGNDATMVVQFSLSTIPARERQKPVQIE